MQIVNKRGNEVKVKDIYPGEVFQDFDRNTYIKTVEMSLTIAGDTCKANAVNLTDGDVEYFSDHDVIYRVEAEVVIS